MASLYRARVRSRSLLSRRLWPSKEKDLVFVERFRLGVFEDVNHLDRVVSVLGAFLGAAHFVVPLGHAQITGDVVRFVFQGLLQFDAGLLAFAEVVEALCEVLSDKRV